MNKDVIYIEPEDDITDILGHIKEAEAKTVALVPPKKAGVLRSSVNFKLIAKAATKAEKTVVLISSDASLVRLAASVAMPVAKNLQSKPELPSSLDADEFGTPPEETAADDVIVEEPSTTSTSSKKGEKSAQSSKPAKSISAKDADMSLDEKDLDDAPSEGKKAAKSRVPDFKKYQKKIIAGVGAGLVLIVFLVWALVIAPAAKIIVKLKSTPSAFSETVSFVADEAKADTENGVFFMKEESTEKSSEIEFAATGEMDKGTKATGTITVVRPKGTVVSASTLNLSIPKGTTFTHGGLSFVTTAAASVNANYSNDVESLPFSPTGTLKRDLSSGAINVVASANGEKYNIAAASSGWTSNLASLSSSRISSTAMTGGSSKIVKVVSQSDYDKAAALLESDTESSIREELSEKLGSDYLIISGSFAIGESVIKSTPNINEEVAEGVTPKLIKSTKYTILAAEKSEVEKYMIATATKAINDDTQQVYATGLEADSDKKQPFFEAFKRDGASAVARLKGSIYTGPRITEGMIAQKSLGKKLGEVNSMLKSVNGVNNVEITTSFFWVRSIPSDINKVQIEIVVEE